MAAVSNKMQDVSISKMATSKSERCLYFTTRLSIHVDYNVFKV